MPRALIHLILPPALNLVLAAVGSALALVAPTLGLTLVALAWLLLLAASLPGVAETWARAVEPTPLDLDALGAVEGVGAIVVLGHRLRTDAPEHGEPSLEPRGLERVRYGAKLHRRTGLPILLSGGDPAGTGRSEAEVMERWLKDEAGIDGAWLEARSRDTRENAEYSMALLDARNIQRIFLVTHATDFSRAARHFTARGAEVFPAAVSFVRSDARGIARFVPTLAALEVSSILAYEALATLRERRLRARGASPRGA